MQVRMLAATFACAACLYGQHHFSWQESCFNNPGLPYCPGHDFAIKRTKPDPGSKTSTNPIGSAPEKTIDATGIDWRFADPSADALTVLNCSKLASSPVAHSLIDQSGISQGLSQADVQNIFRALSGVGQVALSVHDDALVLVVTGRSPDSILPAPGTGWKAMTLAGNALLIGHSDAVDQAAQRISVASPLGELARAAFERQADAEFWAVGSAKLVGQAAVAAGVIGFSMTASMQDHLTSDSVYEFNGIPEAAAIKPWLSSLGNAQIEGNVVRATLSMAAEDVRKSGDQVGASPLGQQLGALVKSARYLPVRDTSTTVHARPVIYGLDDGAKEVKQYVPTAADAAPPRPSSPASPAPAATGLSGTWAFTHMNGRFLGTIEFRQTGSAISGTWHTAVGKSEPDSTIVGRVDGNVITLVRLVGNNQTFVLTLSADASRLDGYGDGWFLNHTNLNMQRAVAVTPSGSH